MIPAVFLAAMAVADPVAGEWRGTSLCQVHPSPCHDEHAFYRIERLAAAYRIHFAKMIDGRPAEFGTLDARWDAAGTVLVMGSKDRAGRAFWWRLKRKGDHLSGELRMQDGTVYRRVELDRVRGR